MNQMKICSKDGIRDAQLSRGLGDVYKRQEYIRKGDVFQIVISQRFQTQVNNDPFSLYRSLRMVNPSPYMSFFDFGSWYLIGSSPEVMVKAEKNKKNQIFIAISCISDTNFCFFVFSKPGQYISNSIPYRF